MGITIGPTYITEEGFEVSELYISFTTSRVIQLLDGNVQLTFIFDAYTSRDNKKNGKNPVKLPYGMNIGETIVTSDDFAQLNFYILAYEAIKQKFGNYTVSDIFEPGQSSYIDYRYNAEGYDPKGYNPLGYNSSGYNASGYNSSGYNSSGYNAQGYNAEGYNASGYNSEGYNSQGYNSQGYNSYGYDVDGYDVYGFNGQGISMNGGYDHSGKLPDGTLATLPSTIMVYNTLFPEDHQSFAVRVEPNNLQTLIDSLTNNIVTKEAQIAAEAAAAAEAQAQAEAAAAAEAQAQAEAEAQAQAQAVAAAEAEAQAQAEAPQA